MCALDASRCAALVLRLEFVFMQHDVHAATIRLVDEQPFQTQIAHLVFLYQVLVLVFLFFLLEILLVELIYQEFLFHHLYQE